MTEPPPLSVARLAVVSVTMWVCATTVPPAVSAIGSPVVIVWSVVASKSEAGIVTV